MRPAQIDGISLSHTVIKENSDKADLKLQPKARTGLHSYKLPRTKDTIVCPRTTFLDWIRKIENRRGRNYKNSRQTTQLVIMGLDETLLNTYTGHARNSKSTNDYYVFAERLKDSEIATKQSDTHGLMK
ncbi:MAG: hypothetical protein EZS28_020904 [Streblomastix strix]|uniref:Uncharacterized protein n=1 Tax=Streblomastix strix TaxID=222440 RepID=A0A5J4VLQ0_9EUKA|nr:MAG: hypothetical protein EZS28_020904 [Streblomastix strix]